MRREIRPMTVPEIEKWYAEELAEAFAPAERKPLADILSLRAEGRYELLGLFNERDELLGYATIWRQPDGAGLVLESEAPVPGGSPAENELRRRRIAFYARNGFQPVYEMATCGMRWQAMLWGPPPRDLTAVMAAHRALYGPERTDVKVPLAPDEVPERPYWMKGN